MNNRSLENIKKGEAMSVLQRVEETYLGILRFVVILVSSLLLVATVVLAVSAAGGLKDEPKTEATGSATVKPDDVIESVVASAEAQKGSEKGLRKTSKERVSGSETDPNKAYYDRIAAAVTGFVTKYSKGVESVEASQIVEVTKNKAERYKGDEHLVSSFASGLATTMESAVKSPSIISRVQKTGAAPVAPARPAPTETSGEESEELVQPQAEPPFKESPLQVVNEVLGTYVRMFDEKVKSAEAEKSAALAEAIERKAEAMNRLYMAGGAFGSFLALVFMSILVKIERNLRAFQPLPAGHPASVGAPPSE